MGIGKRIKEARENLGLTQNELGDLVGVTGSAITNYEKETSHPKEPILYKLLEALRVDANYLFQDVVNISSKKNDVTINEYNFIKKYRSLDPFGQESVNWILEHELSRKSLLDEKDRQIFELEASHNESAPTRIYTYLNKIACAGKGFYFEDIPTATMEAPYMEDADFIVGVSGSSMEPTYYDGDKVYVHRCQIVNIGDIGIFYVNGDCLIKEAGDMGLISHNPAYSMIPGSDNIICVGKVLGKVDSQN